jgi:AraC family transcriptional regulator
VADAFGHTTAGPVVERQFRAPGVRAHTVAARAEAVERAVTAMRERFADQLGLHDLARVALLSSFHFNRVFRFVTGVPPGRFLTAVRMERAKRLLLTTDLRVTDICFDVGYQSLGTFTSRFHELVGVAPQRLRSLAESHGHRTLSSLRDAASAPPGDNGAFAAIDGAEAAYAVDVTITQREEEPTLALIGTFARQVAEGVPVACVAAESPGRARVVGLPAGRYSALAIAYPGARTVFDALLAGPGEIRVGAAASTIDLHDQRPRAPVTIELRRPRLTDPPVVLAVPLLYAERAFVTERDLRTARCEGRNGWDRSALP